ncbi:LLM class flavin-dependent oxidoreductase [Capillimicrobium parvum]|uniref:Alkanal monooxygenase alpha chain n=1 Tax=Capillimicrobium parvum TaxID=2884022 RepID=A0A9E6XY52_9ACTN|nr:LLM class flavin-dependent oxidoreductase [Capillimicrobium parvum]UGS35977.1 Alkanal monooxygenase alpha chain [Capillimicrobium parvum]
MRFTPILIPGTPAGQPEKIDDLLDLIVYAEELGYDGAWITEHHSTVYGRPSPAVILSAAAARTSRLRLGLGVIALPWHYPLDVVEDLATLDVISHGRLDPGFGRGLFPFEYKFFNSPMDESRGRFKESLDFILEAWNTGKAALDGEYWTIPEVELLPQPVQRPMSPWLVALSPSTISMIVARELNGLIGPYLTPLEEVKRTFLDVWRDELDRNGLGPNTLELGHNQHVYVAETDEQAIAEAGEHLLWYTQTLGGLLPSRDDTRETPQYAYYSEWRDEVLTLKGDRLFKDRAVIGSPDTVIEKVRYLRDEGGVTTFLPFMNFGTMPTDLARRSMKLFAEEVIPPLREDAVPSIPAQVASEA